MFVLGGLNVFIAVTMSFRVWAWFISFGAMGAKVVAVIAQYWLFRSIVRRKLRSEPQPSPGTPAPTATR
jgi:intracellular septation protein A